MESKTVLNSQFSSSQYQSDMRCQSINISNIKASIKTECNALVLKNFADNQSKFFTHRPLTNSFFLFKLYVNNHVVVITVYYRGHINVTGIKSQSELDLITGIVSNIPGIIKIKKVSIDNLTATYTLPSGSFYNHKLPFNQVLSLFQKEDKISTVKYSSQKFPGAFIKYKAGGTITLFPSGKINILGCKSESRVKDLVTNTVDILKQ